MPCRDADCGMDQLMREDGRDLRRHGVGRVRQVGPDEDFKMAVRAQAIIPALADRLGLRASAGEADRHAHAVGQGGVQRLEQRSHALRHRIEPAFTGLVGHRPYPLQIACPAMAMPSAGTRTPKNAGGRGGQRDSMGVERPQRSEARPRLIPLRGREGRDRLSPTRQTTRRRTPAPWLARSACDLAPAMWVVTLGQDRSEEHTSELQSLMRISYAVFCLKKKNYTTIQQNTQSILTTTLS